MSRTLLLPLGILAVLLAAGMARAEGLPKLPTALALPQGSDSPGKVTFNHDSHVDTARPSCLACHPRAFSILGRSVKAPREPITHARMEQGQACGKCHGKGKTAFEPEGNCETCHAQ
jgi:c(7)-type cytochrome triheme protein